MYKVTESPITYTFTIQDETHFKERAIINKYKQKLEVKLLANFMKKGYKFEVKTSDFDFNMDKTLKPQEKFIESLAALTENLVLKLNQDGSLISVNSKKVLKKWDDLKEKLFNSHKGNQAQAYIKGVDTKIKDENLFLEDLKQPKLLGLLFDSYQKGHRKDISQVVKINNLIHCLPVNFKETVESIEEDETLQEKYIVSKGSMEEISNINKERIMKYFNYFDIENTPVYLSYYKRKTVLDLQTGYPKSAILDIELTNGEGYVRKQHFNLESNG